MHDYRTSVWIAAIPVLKGSTVRELQTVVAANVQHVLNLRLHQVPLRNFFAYLFHGR